MRAWSDFGGKVFPPLGRSCFGLILLVLAAGAALAQGPPYAAAPAPGGTTPGEPEWITEKQGQKITGQGAAEGREDLPDALDSDGDGYNDYAEFTFGTKDGDPSDHPKDMTPEQANADPKALANCTVEHGCRAHGEGQRFWVDTSKRKYPVTDGAPKGPGTLLSAIEDHPYATAAAGGGILVAAVILAGGGGGDGDGGDGEGGGSGGDPLEGPLAGRWAGSMYGSPIVGTFTAQVARDGAVSGAYEGTWTHDYGGGSDVVKVTGRITGQVAGDGSLTAAGDAGGFRWSGSVRRCGGGLCGSGGWQAEHGDGTWTSP